MTLQQLEYIIALDNYRHFVTAAEKCFVTQPTLTMQVKKLEEEIDVLIFDRTKHPLAPTRTGEIFILQARQVLREVTKLKALITSKKESLEGVFRIGVIPTLAPYLLPLFIGEFSKTYHETRLIIEEMKTMTIIESLKNDKIDLGMLVTPLEEKYIREIPLFYEPFLVYTSSRHPFYKKEKIRKGDISQDGLLLLNEGHCFRDQVLKICNKDQSYRHPNFIYESGSVETLKKLIDHYEGYTLVPELSVIDATESNKSVKRFEAPEPVREVSIVTHHSFATETLIEELRKYIMVNIPDQWKKNEHFYRVKWR